MNKAGIYKITIADHYYFGQSRCLEQRMEQHLRALKGSYHRNPYMQNAWNKYMGDFTFEIVELCPAEDLNDREQAYLDQYIDDPLCMNISPCAEGSRHSPESIEKMRLAKLGKKHTKEAIEKMRLTKLGNKHTKKPVELIFPDGRTKIYESAYEAADAIGVTKHVFYKWIAGRSPWPSDKSIKYKHMAGLTGRYL